MKLTVRDAAQLLSVSEKTIYRWIKQEAIPAYRISDQYRFNRAELLEWATAKKIRVSPEIFAEPEGGDTPSLLESLTAGGIYYRIGGQDKGTVLRAVVDTIKLPDEVDRDFLYQVLLAREALGSTGVGDGIAIPHVRNPIVLHLPRPMVILCFLERPIDFGSIDRQPVATLFTLISPTVRAHLHMLSRLSFALQDAAFKNAIKQQNTREEIFAALSRVEQSMAIHAPAAPGEQTPPTEPINEE